MRLHFATFLFAITSSPHVSGFTIATKPSLHHSFSESSTRLSLKSSDIINNARKAIGQEVLDEPEFKFTKNILNDMRTSLLFLEERVTKGPGSFSTEALREFEDATTRIMNDMNAQYEEDEKKAQRKSIRLKAPGVEVAEYPTASVMQTANQEFEQQQLEKQLQQQQLQNRNIAPPPPPPPKMPSLLETAKSQQQAQQQQPLPEQNESNIEPTSDEEGAAYAGEGGLGLAKGTTNTYVIPGMDEMTGEEYRKALQESVSARQEERRRQTGGMVGNRAAHNYLDQLGYGGASKNLSGNNSA